jgi:hypothetical protein
VAAVCRSTNSLRSWPRKAPAASPSAPAPKPDERGNAPCDDRIAGDQADIQADWAVNRFDHFKHRCRAAARRDLKAARLSAPRGDQPGVRQGLQDLGEKALRRIRSFSQRWSEMRSSVGWPGQMNHHADTIIGGARQLHRRIGSLHAAVLSTCPSSPRLPNADEPVRSLKNMAARGIGMRGAITRRLIESVTSGCIHRHRPTAIASCSLAFANPNWREIVQNVPQKILRGFPLLVLPGARRRCDRRLPPGFIVHGRFRRRFRTGHRVKGTSGIS